MATPVFIPSRVLLAMLALVATVVVAVVLAAVMSSGGGSVATPQIAPASGITVHESRAKSRIVVDGKTATGESVTATGKPGTSAKGKAGKNGTTGSAKGGAGGSASAKGGSATAGSVVIQTTTP